MPAHFRLSRAEVRAIQTSPLGRERGPLVDIVFAPGERGPRAACVVSKKVEPLATKRNMIRRRMRAAFATTLSKHKVSLSFICIAKASARDASSATLAHELARLVGKVVISYNGRI